MTETKKDIRSTSPENFENLYESLGENEKALISAFMDMTFAMLKSMRCLKKTKQESEGRE
ncbi:MAG: hypothetical protein K6G33_12540 [Ruminococcus sp.]|uniref:hypothetical protein n=1 Tax=Ruminococcus sp. TaxID=41978 RepID=UPI0025E7E2FB|nr:hypothetical protein [Ruminococcus sp.]MCR5601557.1 hypothetical protein [Ruminococcus sp.]